MNSPRSPLFYRIIYRLVDLVYPRMELIGTEQLPAEASILVGNHSQAHGPIIAEVRLPFPHSTWCIAQMMNKAEVAEYAYSDFWSQKPKRIRWLYRCISHIIPGFASYLMRHSRTIPVYRDNRCISTFRKTVEHLQEGDHIVIFPEHYVPYNSILWEFEDRFIDVARLYYKKTGKCLQFVPMYLAPKLRKIVFGAPIVFRPEVPMAQERERIRQTLMERITELAAALPEHTVVPYPNLPKKQYPKNFPVEVVRHAKDV